MLILTRKIDQATILETSAGDVRVVVLGIERDRIKLGIEAPASVAITREELRA